MEYWFAIICFSLYLTLLFGLAFIIEKKSRRGRSIVNNPYVYSLSLAVYCTAWTFFGSVGKAASSGIGFLPIYLGPTVIAVLWWFILRKIILISKSQRITSIADFISSRYGKSILLGVLATLVAVIAIIPYISIQLKAISFCFQMLTEGIIDDGVNVPSYKELPFYRDTPFFLTVVMAIFTILFGTRRLDPNERHEGMVAAVAFESLLKLIAFLAIGIFVTFFVFDGFSDLFDTSNAKDKIELLQPILSAEFSDIDGSSWFWMMLLSMSAILFLPRQFHIAVVENTNPNFVGKASWLFPVYLFLINIFVLPIAVGGLKLFGDTVDADTFVLSIPIVLENTGLAIFVALGGFAAATSMVIVAVIALSIMISNNLVLPALLGSSTIKNPNSENLPSRLLGIRRLSISVVLLLSYFYFEFIGLEYTIVSIGLISFVGVAQFAPLMIGGLFWKRATKKGAIFGLITGTTIWILTLTIPTMSEVGILSPDIIEDGFFGISLLKPYALFGLEGMDKISHGAFWSLLFNTIVYITVSLNSGMTPIEVTQADLFVDIYKYQKSGTEYEVSRREAKMTDIKRLMVRFLGEGKANKLLETYKAQKNIDIAETEIADEELIKLAETHLSGAIGAASTKVIINSFVKEDPISLEEIFNVLERTQEIVEYSKELEQTTAQLRNANEQLKELDQLKAEFITSVTHELRTPITSVKALAKILFDNRDLPEKQSAEYLDIIVKESDRVARLVNQVLDLEKLKQKKKTVSFKKVNFEESVKRAVRGVKPLAEEKRIQINLKAVEEPVYVLGSSDQLVQVVVNLLSNAIKFSPSEKGVIQINLNHEPEEVTLVVIDNGTGVPLDQQKMIFEPFSQVNHHEYGKPEGTGLGLAITASIVEQHNGSIWVESDGKTGAAFYIKLPLFS